MLRAYFLPVSKTKNHVASQKAMNWLVYVSVKRTKKEVDDAARPPEKKSSSKLIHGMMKNANMYSKEG